MYALVTGASSGIGKEICYCLAEKGIHLILAARRADRLEKIKQELKHKYSISVVVKECDLSIPKNCLDLFETCRSYKMGILVNSAGFGKVGRIDQIPLEDELEMIQTNLVSLHILTKQFTKYCKKGYILNIASMAAFQPDPKMAAYGATKSYVLNFSGAAACEMKKAGKKISITVLCPGPVNTEFNEVANANFTVRSITARQCAIQAVNGMFHKKSIVIPGFDMKLLYLASKFSPRWLVTAVEYYVQNQKTAKTDQ